MDKRTLRRMIGEKKRAMAALDIEERSARLAEEFFGTEEYRQAGSLYAYMSFNQEVRTRPIIERAWADSKRVAVPKVVGGELRFIWIAGFDALSESGYGILEPANDGPIADDETALVLMPGLAFDPQGHRLGYGGGYYDRYLEAHPLHATVALCYDFQFVEEIEAEEHDVKVGRVIRD